MFDGLNILKLNFPNLKMLGITLTDEYHPLNDSDFNFNLSQVPALEYSYADIELILKTNLVSEFNKVPKLKVVEVFYCPQKEDSLKPKVTDRIRSGV